MNFVQCYPIPHTQIYFPTGEERERASERNGSRPLNAAVAAADSDSGADLSREEENGVKLQHFGGE